MTSQRPDVALKSQYHQHGDEHRYEYLLDAPSVRSRIDAVVRQVSSELVPSQSFAIVSEPGSQDQPWHTDSIPGAGSGLSDAEWRSSLHYIGVLTPIVATGDGCGQTEVKVASHARGDGPHVTSAALSLSPGDGLVLDGRTLHRGMANRTADVHRTMCFFTYKLPRFADGNHEAYMG